MEREDIKNQILSRTEFGLNVFIHYLGDVCKKKNFKNPFREDSRASCRLYYNMECGVARYFMQDFGDSTWCGDCFTIVGRINNLDCHTNFLDILRIIDKDMNLLVFDDNGAYNPVPIKKLVPLHSGQVTKQKDIIPYDSKEDDFLDWELFFWGRFGITEETLKRYNVCSIRELVIHKDTSTNRSISSYVEPMFGYKFGDKGLKVYRPKSTNRFFYLGTFPKPYVFGLDQLPTSGTHVYITGGEKDVLSLAAHGFNAICFNSETAKIPKEILRDLTRRFHYVFIMYDMDETGKKESCMRLRENPEFENLFRVELPLKGTKDSKDISDYFAQNGTIELIYQLTLQSISNQ